MESASQGSSLPLGEDLVAGHIHARPPSDTTGSDVSPRIKRRLRGKTSLAEIERQERGRSRIPEPPRLRMLNRDPADVPIPEGSLVPCSSPISGQNRAHPYTPVGNAVGSSSFEFVPSAVDRAASERGLRESMETIPILRSSLKVGDADTKAHLAYQLLHCCQSQGWQTTWIRMMALRMRKEKKKRSDRSQSRPL